MHQIKDEDKIAYLRLFLELSTCLFGIMKPFNNRVDIA